MHKKTKMERDGDQFPAEQARITDTNQEPIPSIYISYTVTWPAVTARKSVLLFPCL